MWFTSAKETKLVQQLIVKDVACVEEARVSRGLPWSSSIASVSHCAERLPHIPLKLVQAGSRFQ